MSSVEICERIVRDPKAGRAEGVHQNSLKVPNGGTMSGALLDGKEESEREERSSYHQYPFSRGSYEQS